jgi:nucleoside-diphosphate-sugar epimerase
MELITGATGIVGTHLLLDRTAHGPVRALVRRNSDRGIVDRVFRHYRADADALLANIEWCDGDLLDTDALAAAMHGVKHVHHCAAVVSFDPRDTGLMDRVNVRGTANVVNMALEAGVERLCHVSSTAAIGSAAPGVLRNEATPWTGGLNSSPYAISKYEAELEVYRGIAEGLDAVIVNPCIVIGPGLPGRSSMTLMERLHKGTRFFPPGSNSMVDARDVVRCMVELLRTAPTGERYLLVGESLPYADAFRTFTNAFGNPAPRIPIRPWMLEAAWRVERLRSFITGSTPFVTKATAHSAVIDRAYSAEKVEGLLGHRFFNVQVMAENMARYLATTPH